MVREATRTKSEPRGTRITVGDILQWLSGGMSEQEIIEDYPELQKAHIRAVRAKSSILELENGDYGLLEII